MPLPKGKRRWSQRRDHPVTARKRHLRRKSLVLQNPEKKLYFHIPFRRVEEFLPYLNSLKPNLELYLDAVSLESLKGGDLSGGLPGLSYTPSFTVHGPFMDLSPGAVDPAVREVTVSRFSQTLELAESIKARAVVFHSGYEKWKYDHNLDIWLEESIKTWSPLLENAKQRGLRIAIENIFEDHPMNLKALMERIVDEDFGLCFDTGHFNLFSTITLTEWLSMVGERIIELHIHDNDGTRDHHMAPGKGKFDFSTLFRKLSEQDGKELIFTIEAHSKEEAEDSLIFFKERAFSS